MLNSPVQTVSARPAVPSDVARFAMAPIGLGAPYAQNFDTLSNAASTAWTNDATLAGWHSNRVLLLGSPGSSNTGGLHSLGAAASGERALGSLGSGSASPVVYGAQFINDTGNTINSVVMTYTAEQWRTSNLNTVNEVVTFSYQVNAISITAGSWINVPALDLLEIQAAFTGTNGAIDGNLAANRAQVGPVTINVTLAPGDSLWVRWHDINDAGNDGAYAIDDVALEAALASPAPTSTPTATPLPSNTPTVTATATDLPATDTPAPTATGTLEPTATATETATPTNTPTATATSTATATPIPANPCTDPVTSIGTVQGATNVSPLSGSTVNIRGVVIADYEGASPNLRGWYVQDAGDGDPATSDGIFVFDFFTSTDQVVAGRIYSITGLVAEFQDQTQLSTSTLTDCGPGTLPAPVDVTLPQPSAGYFERYEGMLVRLPQDLTVTDNFPLGRFGAVGVSSGGRLKNPTHAAAPGAPAIAYSNANTLNYVLIDDVLNNQNPDPLLFGGGVAPLAYANTLRAGYSVSDVVGIMTYGWGGNAASPNQFRVRPLTPPNFVDSNPRPGAPALPPTTTLKIAAANVLNYFNTFGLGACTGGIGGSAMDCRGADNLGEFDRQWPKTVASFIGNGADIIGFMEMENDGYGSGSAVQHLLNQLDAAAGPGTYAFINPDPSNGVNSLGTDAIKVGLFYKPAKVTPVGTTAALNTVAFVNGGDSAPRSRPALAQAFQDIASGETVIVVVNHLKSKGSACNAPDTGDQQGNCNIVRTNAANALTAWLATDPTGTGDSDVLIMGDLNAYAKEDPITAIKNAGFSNLLENAFGDETYSFQFDGEWGYLDHALASNSLAPKVSGIVEWHINSDEPVVLDYNTNFKSVGQISLFYGSSEYRASDHDPVVIGLALTALPPSATPTQTPTPIDTPVGPTATSTETPTPTNTPPPTNTATPTPTATNTPVPTACAAYQALPFAQNWSDIGQITVNDVWTGVPGFCGFRGDNLNVTTGVDPQTMLSEGTPVLDVNANQTNALTFATGGVAEFHVTDPVVALSGSGTADAPSLVLHISTLTCSAISVAYNVRDLESGTDDAQQQLVLQYRLGASGDFINVAGSYLSDATIVNAVQSIAQSHLLPVGAENQSSVQLRWITTNAIGNDEWIGIDDIVVSGTCGAPATATPTATNTPTPTATDTPVPTATDTPVPTATDTPVPTATDTPTPTATDTPVPTATDTPTPTATDTPVPTATDTPTPTATDTSVPTATATATDTPVPTATATATATNTPMPTATATATVQPTATATATAVSTSTPTSTRTPAPTATSTPQTTGRPDLKLEKRAASGQVNAGQVVPFMLTYANIGNATATGVQLREVVPANTRFEAAASTAGWSCANASPAGTLCTLNLGTLNPGASGSAVFAVKALNTSNGPLLIINVARILDDGSHGRDRNLLNNADFAIVVIRGRRGHGTLGGGVVDSLMINDSKITVSAGSGNDVIVDVTLPDAAAIQRIVTITSLTTVYLPAVTQE